MRKSFYNSLNFSLQIKGLKTATYVKILDEKANKFDDRRFWLQNVIQGCELMSVWSLFIILLKTVLFKEAWFDFKCEDVGISNLSLIVRSLFLLYPITHGGGGTYYDPGMIQRGPNWSLVLHDFNRIKQLSNNNNLHVFVLAR